MDDQTPPAPSPESQQNEPGAAKVSIKAQLPPAARLHVTLELKSDSGETLQRQTFSVDEGTPHTTSLLRPGTPLEEAPQQPSRLTGWWIGLAVALYLLVRLVGLADYPIYFFTDEAVQSVLASDFLRDNLRGYDDVYLPTYFKNVYQYNLGVSVYLQVLPVRFLGKSVEVTRGVNVLVSLIAAASVGLAFRRFFRARHAWLAVLILSATPAWFLHSRTAFECSLAVSFYAGFLYCYLLYRSGQPRAIFAALVFGALSFYSYSPAQMVLAVTALLLGLSDLRYHWQQRRTLLRALGLGLLLALPYLRFQLAHPEETLNHLKQINSYWIQPISLGEKLSRYFGAYLTGLNPAYWYAPTQVDLERHVMDGYGHLLRYSLPFGLLGAWLALKRWRQWQFRALLAAALAAPAGAALVEPGITRLLFMVIPAALITSLGVEATITWVVRHLRLPRAGVALAFALLAVGFNIYLLSDAMRSGPTWSQNYTLTGMQYGARQVFAAASDYAASHPGTRVLISPTWANGADVLERFFLPETSPVRVEGVDGFLNDWLPLDAQTVFVLPPEDYETVKASGKFTAIEELQTLPYPNGKPGFFFIRMRYVDDIQAIFKKELVERVALLESEQVVNGQVADVRCSRLDLGEVKNLFDGDPETLARTLAANPLRLEVRFSKPIYLSETILRIGSTATSIEVSVQVEGEEKPRQFSAAAPESSILRDLQIQFNQMLLVSQVSVQVKNSRESEPAHVHLWEVTFK